MKLLTIFTPTYNRAYCLHQLYESLQRQTCKDFVWLIIDDGSTDGTAELIEGWSVQNKVEIQYIYQTNQGMHGAHNTAYANILTELNVCIDSDDYMSDDAVEKIKNYWEKYGSDKVCGIVGLDSYTNGSLVGTSFPEGVAASTLFDIYYKHGVKGDKKLVYRTELTKQYPYPLFEGENYVGLAYKYYKLDEQYELLLMNEVLCHVEYLEDGSSRNMLKQYRRNPQGFAFYRKALMAIPSGGLVFKYRHAIHYISSILFSRNQNWFKDSPQKLLTVFALIPGYFLYRYILYKTTQTSTSKGKSNDYSVG